MNDFQKYIVSSSSNIRAVIKQIDINGEGFVFIVDENKKIIALLTDGDFRRGVLSGVSMTSDCLSIANQEFISLEDNFTSREAINIFLKKNISLIPILKNGLLTDILHRKDFDLAGKVILSDKGENISVIIMAGGKGTRMKPFTNILPKPLIPVGEKTMLEVIMDEYLLHFKSSFHISVNFKAYLIKAYLNEVKDKYHVSYIEEDNPLGTGGALKYIEGQFTKPFFVSNCDILIKANYQDIYNWHLVNKFDFTIVASMMHYKVPYGVCEISNGGELIELTEKPEYDFLVNAGMYIVNPETLKLIPENTFYNITDLINAIKDNGGKVGVFPVSEKSYIDVGQWPEFRKALSILTD